MNTEEKLQEMENSIEQIMTVQTENSHKLDEVLGCLKGNEMGGIGLVSRFATLENKVLDIEQKSNVEKTKSEIYMGIIKWLSGVIAALVIAYVFNQSMK